MPMIETGYRRMCIRKQIIGVRDHNWSHVGRIVTCDWPGGSARDFTQARADGRRRCDNWHGRRGRHHIELCASPEHAVGGGCEDVVRRSDRSTMAMRLRKLRLAHVKYLICRLDPPVYIKIAPPWRPVHERVRDDGVTVGIARAHQRGCSEYLPSGRRRDVR